MAPWLVVPAALARARARLRSLLASGDVAVAAILAVRTVPIALADDAARPLLVPRSQREAEDRLPLGAAHGPLAGTIASSPRQVVVVHDRSNAARQPARAAGRLPQPERCGSGDRRGKPAVSAGRSRDRARPPRDVRWAPVLRTELWLLNRGLALSIEGLVLALVALVAARPSCRSTTWPSTRARRTRTASCAMSSRWLPRCSGARGTACGSRSRRWTDGSRPRPATIAGGGARPGSSARASSTWPNDPHVSRLYGTHKAPTPAVGSRCSSWARPGRGLRRIGRVDAPGAAPAASHSARGG
jgi:hypothetical protein